MASGILAQLDEQINQWAQELQDQTVRRDAAEERIFELREAIRNAIEVRPSLAKAQGLSELPELKVLTLGAYETVRETYHQWAIGHRQEARVGSTLDDIINIVRTSGFDFGEKNPRRVVNMALVNDPYVDVLPGQRYRINALPKAAEKKGM